MHSKRRQVFIGEVCLGPLSNFVSGGISETKVMPILVGRRVGAQSTRPRPARPFT
jgi:hypothetical protein